MDEQIKQSIRSLAKVLGTWFLAKGLGSDELWEAVAGGISALAAIVWSWWNARQKATLKQAVAGDISLSNPKVTAIVPDPAPYHGAEEPINKDPIV